MLDFILQAVLSLLVAISVITPLIIVIEIHYKESSRFVHQIRVYSSWIKCGILNIKDVIWTKKGLTPIKWFLLLIYSVAVSIKYVCVGLGWLMLICIKSWFGWIVPEGIRKGFERIEHQHSVVKQDLIMAISILASCYMMFIFMVVALAYLPPSAVTEDPIVILVVQSTVVLGIAFVAVWIHRLVNELYKYAMKSIYLEAPK